MHSAVRSQGNKYQNWIDTIFSKNIFSLFGKNQSWFSSTRKKLIFVTCGLQRVLYKLNSTRIRFRFIVSKITIPNNDHITQIPIARLWLDYFEQTLVLWIRKIVLLKFGLFKHLHTVPMPRLPTYQILFKPIPTKAW